MKKISAFFVTAAAAVIFAGVMPVAPVNAVTVLPSDKTVLRDGYTFLGLEGKYITEIQESIDLINQIRLEACNEGVINPESGMPLTKNDYVPIQWSSDLEYIARIRAAEAALTMDHARTNGEWIWFESPGGVSSCAEVIAWNWSESMTRGIDQWYEEKYDWVNNTGGVTGHYTSMISPDHRYVGLAAFCSDKTAYYNTTAGEFSRSRQQLDTLRGSSTGTVIQALEVKDEYISSYGLSGEDDLQVTASVSFTDYWGGSITTEGLTVVGASADSIVWKSSNESVVTVSGGHLKRISCGSSTITAVLPNKTTVKKDIFYDHLYTTVSNIPATCKEQGKTEKKCSICGDTITETIPKTNDHSFEVTTVPATCKDEGKTEKNCKICGYSVTEIIPKTNQHSFGQWETTTKPTESTEGTETRICSVCKLTETRTLPVIAKEETTTVAGETTSETVGDVTGPEDVTTETSQSDYSPEETNSSETVENTVSGDQTSDVGSDDGSPVNAGEDGSGNNAPIEGNGDASDDISDNDGSSNSPLGFIIIIVGVIAAGGAAALTVFLVKRKKK